MRRRSLLERGLELGGLKTFTSVFILLMVVLDQGCRTVGTSVHEEPGTSLYHSFYAIVITLNDKDGLLRRHRTNELGPSRGVASCEYGM